MNKMQMNDIEPTSSENEWFHSPEVRKEFYSDLKTKLIAYQKEIRIQAATQKPSRNKPLRRWINIERLLPTGIRGSVVSILLILVLVSGVAYAASKLSVYLPGFGLVRQDVPVRMLASAKTETKGGIQLKVISALVDDKNTAIVYSLQGIPPGTFEREAPLTPDHTRCDNGAWLELPNGQKLSPFGYGSMGYGKENEYQSIVFFSSFPPNENKFTFHLDCIEGTYPGDTPADWAIPVNLERNAKTLETYPVLLVENNDTNEVKNTLIVSELIPFEDKIIVLGKYIPENEGMLFAQLLDVSFTDANGTKLTYDTLGDIKFFNNDPNIRFAYIVDANSTNFPLVMKINKIQYYCHSDRTFSINENDFPPDNHEHEVDEALNIENCQVKLSSVKNNGKTLTLKFVSENHDFFQINVHEVDNPAAPVTTRFSDNMAIAEVSPKYLAENQMTEIWLGGFGLEPYGPWSIKIEIIEGK